MKFKREVPGEYVSSCGNWCIQCPNRISIENDDKRWYAFKTFTNVTLGPFNTYAEAKDGIKNFTHD